VSDVIRSDSLAPVEGSRKVMILHEFHLLDANAAARLLKTLEEPPSSAVFIVLADQVPPELVTIASRCVRIEFSAIADTAVRDVLMTEGIAPNGSVMVRYLGMDHGELSLTDMVGSALRSAANSALLSMENCSGFIWLSGGWLGDRVCVCDF
jgi:DNA polymerase-3 subunit delta'